MPVSYTDASFLRAVDIRFHCNQVPSEIVHKVVLVVTLVRNVAVIITPDGPESSDGTCIIILFRIKSEKEANNNRRLISACRAEKRRDLQRSSGELRQLDEHQSERSHLYF